MNSLKKFKSECKGGVAAIFALAILPLMVAAGLALDYARALGRRSELQNALDAAILSVTRQSGSVTSAQMYSHIMAYIKASSDPGTEMHPNFILDAPQAEIVGTTVTASVSAKVPTTLLRLMGIEEVQIAVATKATWAPADVVIVLDTSGTVAAKLPTLQTAIENFIHAVGGGDGTVQIGLMPFAVSARVPVTSTYKNADWILFNGDNRDGGSNAPTCEDGEDGEDGSCSSGSFTPIIKSTWQGCLTDRPKNYDTDDTNYKGVVASGENIKRYPALQLCRTGESQLGTVFPLTSNFTDLVSHVRGLHAGGGTNFTIGVAWGHALLSETIVPFTEGRDVPPARKIMVFIGGSAQTKSRWSADVATLNSRTRTACASARNHNVEIYAVRINSTADADTLSSCASSPANYFNAPNTDDIATVFTELAQVVRQPRLTH